MRALEARFHFRIAIRIRPCRRALPPASTSRKPPFLGLAAAPPGSRMAALSSRKRPHHMTIFKGFEADRYQQHDATIREAVLDFNNNKAARVGCSADQALALTTLDEDVVKSWMIQESGGGDAGSLAAWKIDPVQANVPGDWTDTKTDLGLAKPKARNEGDIKTNLKAGIVLMARKGFGKSGLAPKPTGTFDGWQVALQRYNGRTDGCANGKMYSQNYADAIWARAQDPKVARPIQIG
jgi:hypothetical protein